MTQKRKIYYLLLLFFSTFLISSCRQSTSNNFQFSSSITPTESSKPYFKLTTADNTAIMTMEATASNVTATKDETTYKNIAPHTDVIYKKIENGIKEEIILSQSPDSAPSYKFTLDFGNLKPQFFQGQYYFFDEEGYARFTIPRPFMVDAAGVKSEAISLKISDNLSTVTPDYQWLSDPQRKYPVTIDPTIVTPDFPLRELADKRTISAKTYDLGGGKYAATSGMEAIHYQDSRGKWQEKDTTIIPSSDPEYNYMNTTNNFQTFFSTDGFGQKKAVKFQVKDSWMKFKIINASGSGQKNEAEDNKFQFSEIYKNGDKTMAAAYTLETDRLLEEVVLNKFQGFPEIKQEIELHNAILKPDGKKINAYHPTTSELLWVIPEPVMYELNRPENRNYGLHYEISCQNSDCSNLILSKVIDPEGQTWLSDPNQNYPLVIDTTAGPSTPNSLVGYEDQDGNVWNDDSAYLVADSDDDYASFTMIYGYSEGAGPGLMATNFGFSIPSGATINGIVSEIEMAENNNAYSDYFNVYIVKNNYAYGLRGGSHGITDVDTYYTTGNSSYLWFNTWTPADINNSGFGIFLKYVYCDYNEMCGYYDSLHKNSLVNTPLGNKKISQLKNGDFVYSYNEKTKKIEIKKVINVQSNSIIYDNNRYFYIYYQNKIIKATENHKFYVGGSYFRADELKVGDELLGTDLRQHPIEKIEIVKNYIDTVWDINVEDNHNFFVEGVLTHNRVPSNTAFIDHIRMTIYYTEPPTTPTPTPAPTATPTPTPTPAPTATPTPVMRFEGVKMEGIKIN